MFYHEQSLFDSIIILARIFLQFIFCFSSGFFDGNFKVLFLSFYWRYSVSPWTSYSCFFLLSIFNTRFNITRNFYIGFWPYFFNTLKSPVFSKVYNHVNMFSTSFWTHFNLSTSIQTMQFCCFELVFTVCTIYR